MVIKREYQPHGPRLGKLKNDNPPCDLASLPRCTATSKSTGKGCGQPAMKGKRVCYYHGGKSPGAPKENQFAFKHGYYSAQATREREELNDFLRNTQEIMKKCSDDRT